MAITLSDSQRRDLSRAVARVRAAPRDAEARFLLCRQLMRASAHRHARFHALRLARDLPPGSERTVQAGRLLYRLGLFAQAVPLLQRAGQDYNATLDLAAALRKLGREEDGARAAQHAARLAPVVPPARPRDGRPNVLRIRTFENSYFRISRKQGLYRRLMTGGHFSTKFLVEKDAVNIYVGNEFGGNIPFAAARNLHIILNTVACPDRQAPALTRLAGALDAVPHIPVVNHPAKVLRTTREENARRLAEVPGIRFPRTVRVVHEGAPEATIEALAELGVTAPMILRFPGTQTGTSVALLETADAVRAHLAEAAPGTEYYAIEVLDCRDSHGLWRKARCFFIGGQFYPVALLGNDVWQIHSGDRYRVMDRDPRLQAEERAYLSEPESLLGSHGLAALQRVADLFELDFFGIDFFMQPDRDEVVIFEANAAMRHNYDHADNFPYTRPHLDRIGKAFHRMLMERALPWRPAAA